MSIEDLASQSECTPVNVRPMPTLAGNRHSVSVYVGKEGSRCFPGYVVKSKARLSLIHDFKVSGLDISHVAMLSPTSTTSFKIVTEFASARQQPHFDVEFYGELLKTPDGYMGLVTLKFPGHESTQSWEIVDED